MPKWVWFAGGCLLLLLLGIGACIVGVGIAGKKVVDTAKEAAENPAKAAELIIKAHPEFEHVETDEGAGTITIRDKSSGEETTLDFEDIKKGRFRVQTKDGESTIDFSGAEDGSIEIETPEGKTSLGKADLDDVPDWVLLHPDGSGSQAMMTSSGTKGTSGMIAQQIADTERDAVMDWFAQSLEDEGWEVETSKVTVSGQPAAGSVSARQSDPRRTITVGVTEKDGGAQVMVTYEGE